MASKKGREYEHDLADLIVTQTDGELVPLATGYNSQYSESVDLLIDDGAAVHAFELKRTKKDAYTLHWDEDDYSKDDLYQLGKFCVEYPRPTYPYAGVRFNNRQLTLSKQYIDDWPDTETYLENGSLLCNTETSVTHSDNLRFYQPDAGDWPSTDLDTNDAQHVLDTIGYTL